jgi:HEAT repeat protein
MTPDLNLTPALTRLESDDLGEQAAALDEATVILNEFGRRLVDRFVHCEDRFIIWERLFRFGPFVIEPLKEILAHTADQELRGLSATILLKLGDRTAIPVLLDAIASSETLICQAAAQLAEAQVVEAADVMIERLRSLDFTTRVHILSIQCLLITLRDLGKTLPPDLVERFQSPEAPWEVRVYME